MEALTRLCLLGTILSFAQAQVDSEVTLSSGSLVTIALVCVLPVTAIVIIWTACLYYICKNERDYRKVYKALEKKEQYLKRNQQRIKQAQQVNATACRPAPSRFHQQAKANASTSTNISLPALGKRSDYEKGNLRVQDRPYSPQTSSAARELIGRLPPHIGYQQLTEELRQHHHAYAKQRCLQASKNRNRPSASGGQPVDLHDYATDNSISPFNFQFQSLSRGYAVKLPAKDYPLTYQPKTSAHSSNNTAFGQLSTWPQFN